MKRKRIYLAHCLSAPTPEEMAANRLDAKRWGCWLAKTFDVAVVMDWVWMSEIWTEAEGRALGLEIDKVLIDGCVGVFMCGPRVSSGMNVEEMHAREAGLRIKLVIDDSLESFLAGRLVDGRINAIRLWVESLPEAT